MKPVKFKQFNVVYAENQPQYQPLPVHRTDNGILTSCWKLNWWERLKMFFTGRIYIAVMTFGSPPQPLLPDTSFRDHVHESQSCNP